MNCKNCGKPDCNRSGELKYHNEDDWHHNNFFCHGCHKPEPVSSEWEKQLREYFHSNHPGGEHWVEGMIKIVRTLLASERQKAYRQGHIDHQLTLEASTDDLVKRMKGKSEAKTGESISYSGKEILAKERQRTLREAREAVLRGDDCKFECWQKRAAATIDSLIEKE